MLNNKQNKIILKIYTEFHPYCIVQFVNIVKYSGCSNDRQIFHKHTSLMVVCIHFTVFFEITLAKINDFCSINT